ncbi:hypothetical protein [Bacillus sp. ISL-37]|uniref:hypothetical protein n=1 Tax=Bacillus sp. ISL-37 TaxID=2819123 RepID=UPI003369F858
MKLAQSVNIKLIDRDALVDLILNSIEQSESKNSLINLRLLILDNQADVKEQTQISMLN